MYISIIIICIAIYTYTLAIHPLDKFGIARHVFMYVYSLTHQLKLPAWETNRTLGLGLLKNNSEILGSRTTLRSPAKD